MSIRERIMALRCLKKHGEMYSAGFTEAKYHAVNLAESRERELLAQRDELLAALKYSVNQVPELGTVPGVAAAIAKAEGGGA